MRRLFRAIRDVVAAYVDGWKVERQLRRMMLEPGVYSIGAAVSIETLRRLRVAERASMRVRATITIKPELANTAQELADKRIPSNFMGRDWLIERVFTVGDEVKCDVVEYDASIFDWEAPDAVEAGHLIGYRRN